MLLPYHLPAFLAENLQKSAIKAALAAFVLAFASMRGLEPRDSRLVSRERWTNV
jgi:hypothetical protein